MKRSVYVVLIVFTVIALDQITKYFVISYIGPFDSLKLSSFLHLVNVRNTGAAFGMFKNFSSSFFIGISAVAIIFVIWLLFKSKYNYFGLSLVLSGAIGNLIDRMRYGKVVDFIDFSAGSFHWPAFNVADSSLTIGIILIFLTSFFRK
jgi:signal peptidase II